MNRSEFFVFFICIPVVIMGLIAVFTANHHYATEEEMYRVIQTISPTCPIIDQKSGTTIADVPCDSSVRLMSKEEMDAKFGTSSNKTLNI